ncbi:hypothetical protein J2S25_000518 [Mesobacillus stamsii]|uniref:Uncharacterized protein n=1 Tax=Mesobacillus stamsii TaxID=225347 RepID=A0ABU0FR05_9BACI|nr:hypothetical protein [Mesobacillus stamsii]
MSRIGYQKNEKPGENRLLSERFERSEEEAHLTPRGKRVSGVEIDYYPKPKKDRAVIARFF